MCTAIMPISWLVEGVNMLKTASCTDFLLCLDTNLPVSRRRGWQSLAFTRRAFVAACLVGMGLGLSSSASAQSCVPNTTPDWMVTSDQLAQDIRPRDCSSVEQSPPDFRWPDVSSTASYSLTLTY